MRQTQHSTLFDKMRNIENVVRVILRQDGIKLSMPTRAAFAGWVRELTDSDGLVMNLVEPLLAVLVRPH